MKAQGLLELTAWQCEKSNYTLTHAYLCSQTYHMTEWSRSEIYCTCTLTHWMLFFLWIDCSVFCVQRNTLAQQHLKTHRFFSSATYQKYKMNENLDMRKHIFLKKSIGHFNSWDTIPPADILKPQKEKNWRYVLKAGKEKERHFSSGSGYRFHNPLKIHSLSR